ncbi:HIT family protein, partial [Cryobacterium sp. MLB-32]|uniref:HIT family protein n=1 Tax=Cryobacterium sp. MLB-32 TaxID=1529318 RepID=UPI0012DFFAB7
PDLSSLTLDELVEAAIVAQRVDRALRVVLGVEVEGTNLHMSNGSSAGQDVMHAHLHVIPRSAGDGLELREDLSRYPHPPLTRDERSAIAFAISD